MRERFVLDASVDRKGLVASVLLHGVIVALFLSVAMRSETPSLPSELSAPAPVMSFSMPSAIRESPDRKSPDMEDVALTKPLRQSPSKASPDLPSRPTVEAPATMVAARGSATDSSAGVATNGIASVGEEGGRGTGALTPQTRAQSESSEAPEAPQWIVKPTDEQLLKALPTWVAAGQLSGSAVLSCLVTPANRVRSCRVLSATHANVNFLDYNFGEGAMRLSRSFLVRPPTRNGQPRYDIPVRIPIDWRWN